MKTWWAPRGWMMETFIDWIRKLRGKPTMVQEQEASQKLHEYLAIRKRYPNDIWHELLERHPDLRKLQERLRSYNLDNAEQRATLVEVIEWFHKNGSNLPK